MRWAGRSVRQRLITAIVALLFGVLGMGLWVVGIHLYQDHQNLHVLINLEVQRSQAPQAAQPPPAK